MEQRFRLRWPSTEWRKDPGKMEMAPGLKWPKNGCRNGKNRERWPKSHFGGHFSISAAIFRPFQAGGHFPFFFLPFSPGFLRP